MSDRPYSEAERLEILRGFGVLDTPPDPLLDAITRMAARVAETPVALVSLVDEERQWFKSRCGFEVEETDRSVAFCDVVVRDGQEVIVPNALEDSRFKDNPLVTKDPHIRFYAGVPLVEPSGALLGTLCVIAYEPRTLSELQLSQLRDLTQLAVRQLVALRQEREIAQSERVLRSKNAMLDLVHEAQSGLLAEGLHREWWDHVLDRLLDICDSEYGFIGRIDEDADGRFLQTTAITDISWNEETRTFYEENSPAGLVFRNLDTLFGRPIVEGKALISNDVAHDPRAGGRPEGHPPLNAFAGVPIHSRGKMLGMVGLANRPGGYSEDFLTELAPVLAMVGTVLENSDLDAARLGVINELKGSRDFLERVLEASESGVVALGHDGRLTLANRRAREMFRDLTLLERQDMAAGKADSLKFLLPNDADRDWALQAYSGAQPESTTRETSIVGPGGVSLEVEVTVTAFQSESDSTSTLLLSVADVASRNALKQTQSENASLEQRIGELRHRQQTNEILSESVELLQNCADVEEGLSLIAHSIERLFPEANVTVYGLHPVGETFVRRRQTMRWQDPAAPDEMETHSCWGLRSRRVYGSWPKGHYPACNHAAESTASFHLCAPLFSLDKNVALICLSFPPEATEELSEERFRAGMSEFAAMAQTMSGALSTIALRESLQAMATVDELTGVWNRRAFETEAERAIARHQRNGEPFVMAILDIDHFKKINDDFGHDVGDRALRSVADVLQSQIRLGDFVGRLGGEEFGIFLTGLEPGGDRAALMRLLTTIRSTCSVGDRSVTASIGFTSGVDGLLYHDLFKRADVALYRAKAQGRDRVENYEDPVDSEESSGAQNESS